MELSREDDYYDHSWAPGDEEEGVHDSDHEGTKGETPSKMKETVEKGKMGIAVAACTCFVVFLLIFNPPPALCAHHQTSTTPATDSMSTAAVVGVNMTATSKPKVVNATTAVPSTPTPSFLPPTPPSTPPVLEDGPDEDVGTASVPPPVPEPPIPLLGGQRDEHGCLIGAGYTFCPSLNMCVRLWEVPCPDFVGAAATTPGSDGSPFPSPLVAPLSPQGDNITQPIT